jgi:hypothetical protein
MSKKNFQNWVRLGGGHSIIAPGNLREIFDLDSKNWTAYFFYYRPQ